MFLVNIEEWVSRIRPFFQDHIWNRGRQYYRSGHVVEFNLDGDSLIKAKVAGSKTYRVEIDLKRFAASTCTCPYGDYCKHMAAVLLKVSEQPVSAKSKPENPGKKGQLSLPKETDTTGDWHHYFAKQMGTIEFYGPHSLESLYSQIQTLLSAANDWALPLQQLYQIHIGLFHLKQLDSLYQTYNSRYYYYDLFSLLRQKSNKVAEELAEAVRELDVEQVFHHHSQHLLETADFLARHAFPKNPTPVNWLFVYRYVWTRLLNYKPWEQQERLRLREELSKTRQAGIYKNQLVMALAHFELLDGNDQAARELIEHVVSDAEPAYLLGYMYSFQANQQWDRLFDWLTWASPFVRRWDSLSLKVYLEHWQELAKHKEVDAELRQTAVFLLPRSYSYYSDYLMEQEQYQEWVDLNLFCNFSPLEVDRFHLKKVESKSRHLLLPLYHQAVERHILEKNRNSYKQAVRLLKKLQRHYKQLKEESRWQEYIEFISRQYSRYRAFQEELRKGSLVV